MCVVVVEDCSGVGQYDEGRLDVMVSSNERVEEGGRFVSLLVV